MHPLDFAIVVVYFAGMLAFGFWLRGRQSSLDEYFVGGRQMGAGHVGFSVVATDVGGGFSIGLGGLGFAMGLSASWLLFTGLIGAWLAAVLLIPKVKTLGIGEGHRTFPDFLAHRFDERTRIVAATVSMIGYAGFTGAQLLAGGKLTAAAFGLDVTAAVLVMSVVIVSYTALGGLEAVIYTDSIQWAILLVGLLLLALPLGFREVGGFTGLVEAVPPGHLQLFAVEGGWKTFATWLVTIVPIWFVGMTLYQRIHATRDVATAKRAWFLAGLLEWPLMAFAGAILGSFGRVLYPTAEAEMGLPMLIRDVLPIGATGLVIAAYLAAIMSTADSCLLASVGNAVDDLYARHVRPGADERHQLRLSRTLVLIVGFGSVAFALYVPTVIESILLAYSFMVSGLLLPTVAALFWPRVPPAAAFWSIVAGGGLTVVLTVAGLSPAGWDPVFYGLGASAATMALVTAMGPAPPEAAEPPGRG